MDRRFYLFGAAIWFCWFSLYAYVPILSPYVSQLDPSYQMVGLVLSCYGIAQMLLRLPLGIVSDKYNIRTLLIKVMMFLCMVSAFGMWIYQNIYATLVFRTLSGVAATAWVLQPVTFASFFSACETTKAMGIVTAILNCGEMAGMLAGGIAAHHWGFEAAFLLAAMTGGIGFLLIIPLQEHGIYAREPIRWSALLTVAKDRLLNVTAVLGLILQVFTFSTVFGFTPLIARKLGLSNLELGILSTLFMLPGILASTLSGTFFARRIGETKSIVGGYVVMGLFCIVIPYISSAWALYFWQTISGFARGLVFPMLMGIGIKDIAAAKRATAMGYSQAIYGLGMFLGPLIMGSVSEAAGLEWGFFTIGIISLSGACLMGAYSSTTKPLITRGSPSPKK